MNGPGSTVGVVTMTRGGERIPLLRRAVDSVAAQDTAARVQHLVVVDDCPETFSWLERNASALPPGLRRHRVGRTPDEEYDNPSQRCSKLRNLGVAELDAQWICFLDDDNVWEPDHLRSLLDCAERTGAPAVHSERHLYWRNGEPYLEPRYPWVPDEERARLIHAALVEHGVFRPGSHRMRDRVERPRPGTAVPDMADPARSPVMMVDPNEWLLARDLLLRIPFREDVAAADRDTGLAEDGLFLIDLVQAGVPVACTGRATVGYYLGGFSNTAEARPSSEEA